ncbi:MAG: glycosyltransferase family 4 protein, partial [Conexivisphaerales archaeon]|nr:glycosyltransferase family 4 protein [Conexivisphaerales archaeon]
MRDPQGGNGERPLRVLWFNHRDIRHPRAGGAERTIYEVGRRLAGLGYDVNLFSVNPGGLPNYELLDGIRVRRAPGNVSAHALVPLALREVRPDVVVDDLAHVVPWASPLFTARPTVAFFRHLHSRTLPGQVGCVARSALTLLERQYPRVYGNSAFVTETQTSIEDLVAMGIERKRIHRILPGVDHSLFRPAPKSPIPTLVYFGGMRDYKRPWLALDVLKGLSEAEARLYVVGDGPSLPRVREAATRSGLGQRVVFTGRLSEAELADLVSSSWVNLHFSLAEGFGLSVVEAAAAGTPSVVTEAPGVSEVVREFGLGLVAKGAEEAAEAVERMLRDEEGWSAKVRAGSESFSWERSATAWDELLKAISARRRKAANPQVAGSLAGLARWHKPEQSRPKDNAPALPP